MVQIAIVDMIEKYDTIIIHHHINPDPDCIGSQLGLKWMIEESYPHKTVFAVGDHNDRTEFIGSLDVIADDVYDGALVIIVDVGDKARIDDNRFMNGKALIKIDHHPLTETFADIEWVDTGYAAVTEMILDIYRINKDRLKLNTNAARALYSGLLTDTGRFYYDSVTERTLTNAAIAYEFDFDKQDLYSHLYYKSVNEVKFTGFIMKSFSYTSNGLGYLKVTDDILNEFNLTTEFASGMVNTLANIKEVIMWVFFVEYKDRENIRVEFRSRGPIVNSFARRFGGGGHKWASGAICQTWDEVDTIVKEADLLCEQFQKENK